MANRIMGITVEIGRDTTKLQTALKSVRYLIRRILLQQMSFLPIRVRTGTICRVLF